MTQDCQHGPASLLPSWPGFSCHPGHHPLPPVPARRSPALCSPSCPPCCMRQQGPWHHSSLCLGRDEAQQGHRGNPSTDGSHQACPHGTASAPAVWNMEEGGVSPSMLPGQDRLWEEKKVPWSLSLQPCWEGSSSPHKAKTHCWGKKDWELF